MVKRITKKLDQMKVLFPVVGFILYIKDGRIINIETNRNRKRLQKKKNCLAKNVKPLPLLPPPIEKKFVEGIALV